MARAEMYCSGEVRQIVVGSGEGGMNTSERGARSSSTSSGAVQSTVSGGVSRCSASSSAARVAVSIVDVVRAAAVHIRTVTWRTSRMVVSSLDV